MKSRKEILLELTPLLDVILIMMFYILMQNSLSTQQKAEEADRAMAQVEASAATAIENAQASASQAEEAYESLSREAREEASSLQEDKQVLEAQLLGSTTFSSYAVIAEITIVNGAGGNRKLHVVQGEHKAVFSYDWEQMRYAENALKNELEGVVGQASAVRPVFLVFVYENDGIYRRDYDMVRGVLDDMATKGNHIYIKYTEGGTIHE